MISVPSPRGTPFCLAHFALRMQEHVENSTRLNADIRRLNENLETFSKLTRQLANSGAMQTVLRLVGEVQLMLQSATSAAKVYVYLPAGVEGYKSVSNPETGSALTPTEAMQAEAKRVAFAYEGTNPTAIGCV